MPKSFTHCHRKGSAVVIEAIHTSPTTPSQNFKIHERIGAPNLDFEGCPNLGRSGWAEKAMPVAAGWRPRGHALPVPGEPRILEVRLGNSLAL